MLIYQMIQNTIKSIKCKIRISEVLNDDEWSKSKLEVWARRYAAITSEAPEGSTKTEILAETLRMTSTLTVVDSAVKRSPTLFPASVTGNFPYPLLIKVFAVLLASVIFFNCYHCFFKSAALAASLAIFVAFPAPKVATLRAIVPKLVTWSQIILEQTEELVAAPMPQPVQFGGEFAQQTGPTS